MASKPMPANRAIASVRRQFKMAIEKPNPCLRFAQDPNDAMKWYVMFLNIEAYPGGEYIMVQTADKRAPIKEPPSWEMLTPNGVFEPNKSVCVHIGKYHPDNYDPTNGLWGFAEQILSGMIVPEFLGGGINVTHTSDEKRKKLAAESKAYNRKHNATIVELIEASYAEYSAAWDVSKLTDEELRMCGLERPVEAALADVDLKDSEPDVDDHAR